MLRQIARPLTVPPTLTFVRTDDVAPTRWRNGGGWTRELVAWPSAADWVVRVSVADIASDGPFSAFPGVDRWFAVLDGEGVELDNGAGAIALRAGDAIHRFRGEAAPHCRLVGGPTRDFNVMHKRDAGVVQVTPLGEAWSATADWTACLPITPLRVRLAGDELWQHVPAGALAWTTAPARLQIDEPGARGWRIELTLAKGTRR
jgi:environmental stress-induced protein Ves